jgi:ACS family tartrate transporter-like MFS transporter
VSDDRVFVKCAWRLIPFMMLLYVVSFIDRVNVGFAALTMNKELGFSPSVFGLGAGAFFIGYSLFQVPANLILERIGARRWMFSILAIWGALSASNAFTQDAVTFYILRFLLGLAEAGFFPGMILYLTFWFPQAYRARFTAMFMAAIPLSFIVGGPLSSLILRMDRVLGLSGWQWLFLLEGLPAFSLSFAVLQLLPDGPNRASWLTRTEKEVIAVRLSAEDTAEQRELWPALRDPRVAALGLVNFGILLGNYGVQFWLPQIVHGMGFSNFTTGFVAALPFVAAMCAMILWGRSSDARGERIWHVALPALVGAAGLAMAALVQNYLLSLMALTVAVVGVLTANALLFSLPSLFLGGRAAAGGIALIISIASLGGFFGPTIIGVLKEQTGDYSLAMVALAIALVLSAAVVLALGRAMAPRQPIFPSPNAGLRAEQIAGGDLPTES